LDKEGRTFTNYTEKEGMNFGIFESIVEDRRGDFWFGTLGGGITRLDVRRQTLRHFTEAEGLSHNTVFGLREDKAGNLWISSRTGLNKLSKKELEKIAATPYAPVHPFFKKYTPENGNMGFAEGRYYLLEAQNGDLWIPKMDRLTIYHPRQDTPNLEASTVELTNIKLYNEAIAWKKDTNFVLKNGFTVQDFTFKELSPWQMVPEELSLAFNNNFLTFEFAAVNTNAPQAVSYQYRLKGLENNWSAITQRSEATYGNLSPGSYTFCVKAVNEEGVWSKEVSYSFTIRPPWWQTWWCYLLYSLAIGGMIYVFIQYRVAQRVSRIKALEAIRTKISGDLHDDVGTILSGLAMQSQMMALTAKDGQKEALNELSTMSHDAMERMRDTVWAIDSRKDKYENLIDRMRDFAERNLNRKQISHDFTVELEDGKKFIDPQKRQNLYLIFKEAITNIVKHSDATHVTIVFSEQKKQLHLMIHDNGSQLQNLTPSDGLGLSNMQMRATQLGGRLKTTYEAGFKVELTLE
jgi:signal transduction histidine kinase